MENINDYLNFIKSYEIATNSHNFDNVEKLLDDELVYFFSDGSYFDKQSLRKAFVSTWNNIQNETYKISDIKFLYTSEESALFIYNFYWSGIVDGIEKQGKGRGTNLIIKKQGKFLMKHEHLSVL